MPCLKCQDNTWKWGQNGECVHESEEACKRANSDERKSRLAKYKLTKPDPKLLVSDSALAYTMSKEGDETILNISGIVGDFWDGMDAATVVERIQSTDGPIVMRLNTPGGLVFEGFDIFDALATHPDHVRADIVSMAWSIGAVLAMAADEVRIRPHAPFGIHQAWTGFLLLGNAREIRAQMPQLQADLEHLDSIDLEVSKLLADRSGNTVKQVTEWLEGEEGVDGTEFIGQAAVDAGFADSLIENPKKETSERKRDAASVARAKQRDFAIRRQRLTSARIA